jgi:hypothetical protein
MAVAVKASQELFLAGALFKEKKGAFWASWAVWEFRH